VRLLIAHDAARGERARRSIHIEKIDTMSLGKLEHELPLTENSLAAIEAELERLSWL
jgi:hypothetical protein